MLEEALAYNLANRDACVEQLKKLVAIPSVGTDPAYAADTRKAAQFVADKLKSIGMDNVEVVEGNPGEYPLVKAEWLGAPGKPTVLCYAHYDVQPADPLDHWLTPPFEPIVRNGKLYGRGAADDKGGGLWISIAAIESYLKTAGKLPVNVKVLIEGEEENLSSHIHRYVESQPAFLDGLSGLIVLDGGFFGGLPTILTRLRGIVTADITVRANAHDLHSGKFGGVAPNPVHALSQIIAALRNPEGIVTIPDFYKHVRKVTRKQRQEWKKLPFDEAKFLKGMGASCFIGSKRYSVLERLFARPTLDVTGMAGGYLGAGFKTLIPAQASAKVSMRLVPDMVPEQTYALLVEAIRKATPPCISAETDLHLATPAVEVDTSDPLIKAGAKAMQDSFNTQPLYVPASGSVPVCHIFQTFLQVPMFVSGFAMPDSQAHAPNENQDLATMFGGIDTMTRYFWNLGQ